MTFDRGAYPPDIAKELPLRDEALVALLKSAAAGGVARLSWGRIAEEARRRRRRRSAWQLVAAALILVVAVGVGIELYRALLPTPTLVITDETLPGDTEPPPGNFAQPDVRQVQAGELPAGVERAVGTAGDHVWAMTAAGTFENHGPTLRGWGGTYRAEASSDARVIAYGPSDSRAGGPVVVWTGLDAPPGKESDFELSGDLLLTGFSLSPSGRGLILMGAAPPENQGIDAMTRHLFLIDTGSGSRRELPWVLEGSYGLDGVVWATDEQSIYLTAAHTGGADADRVYRLDLATGTGERIPDMARVLAAGPDGIIAGLARAEVELYQGMPELYNYYNGTPGVWSVMDTDGNREPLVRRGEGSVDPGLLDRAVPVQAHFSPDPSMVAVAYLRQDHGVTFVVHAHTAGEWAPVASYVGGGSDEWGIGGRVLGWDPAGSAWWFGYRIPEGTGTETQPPGQYLVRLPARSGDQRASFEFPPALEGSALPGPVLAILLDESPPATPPTGGPSTGTTHVEPTSANAAQILDNLLGQIRALRTGGDIFLPETGLFPHEQPGFATGPQGVRTGYRINYEVDGGMAREVTLGVDHQELTAAYLDLKAAGRLTPTGLSFEGHEWQQGTTLGGDVILGVEIPAAESVDPYVLTVRVKSGDIELGLQVAEAMKRFVNP
ncbi:MAG: TolB-like translocation protein [Thermoleophilia bacterium]